MGDVLVTGGTGSLGREVVAALLARGQQVRLASRRPRPPGDHGRYSWATVDFRTGSGLADAAAGIDAVVHCASATRPGRRAVADEDIARFLTGALSAGTHLVFISIVGVDAIPLGYYRHKLAAEDVICASGLPWTILRTTQFHSLVLAALGGLGRLPAVLPVPSGIRLQPIAEAEVGARLADLTLTDPAGRAPDLGGPLIEDVDDLARRFLSARHLRRRVVGIPLGGSVMRALRSGANLAPDNPGGRETFQRYLDEAASGAGR